MLTPRFVLVDDDPLVLEFMEILLRTALPGSDLQKFAQSREALFHIMQDRPDFVVTDFQMPHLDGVELIQHLRDFGFEAPILMISNHPLVRPRALSAGATAFLDKIEIGEHLTETVKTILRNPTVSA